MSETYYMKKGKRGVDEKGPMEVWGLLEGVSKWSKQKWGACVVDLSMGGFLSTNRIGEEFGKRRTLKGRRHN